MLFHIPHSILQGIKLLWNANFLLQVDYEDYHFEKDVLEKSDIQKGKITWLLAKAVQKATAGQKNIIQNHYGKANADSEKMIKNLYGELKIDEDYVKYKEEKSETIESKLKSLENQVPTDVYYALFGKVIKTKWWKLVQTFFKIQRITIESINSMSSWIKKSIWVRDILYVLG